MSCDIKWAEFPGCCVSTVLHNFGGSRNRGFEGKQASLEDMKKRIQQIAKGEVNHGFKLDKLAVTMASLTTEQDVAIQCLTEIGFTPSEKYEKAKHKESDLIVFSIASPKLYEWAKNYKEPPKRETFNLNKNPTRKLAQPVAQPVAAAPTWDEDFEEEDI